MCEAVSLHVAAAVRASTEEADPVLATRTAIGARTTERQGRRTYKRLLGVVKVRAALERDGASFVLLTVVEQPVVEVIQSVQTDKTASNTCELRPEQLGMRCVCRYVFDEQQPKAVLHCMS